MTLQIKEGFKPKPGYSFYGGPFDGLVIETLPPGYQAFDGNEAPFRLLVEGSKTFTEHQYIYRWIDGDKPGWFYQRSEMPPSGSKVVFVGPPPSG